MGDAAEKKEVEPRHVVPLKRGLFGVMEHKFQQFSAEVPPGTTVEDLEDPRFWSHVANAMLMGCEVRIVAQDLSYRAEAIVTYKYGNNVRVKVFRMDKLDNVDPAKDGAEERFKAVLKGTRKWCVVDKQNGQDVFENIPTQHEALLRIAEHEKALSR